MFERLVTDQHWLARLRRPVEDWPEEVRLQSTLTPLPEGEEEPLVEYSGLMATEDPWFVQYWGENDNGGWGKRWLRLQLSISSAKMEAKLRGPVGVQVGLSHSIHWGGPSVGRVLSAKAGSGELRGDMRLSVRLLESYGLAPGLLDAGIGSGLSVGIAALETPKAERREGTRKDPDRLTYGKVRLQEVSLTPIPALVRCGLTGRRRD